MTLLHPRVLRRPVVLLAVVSAVLAVLSVAWSGSDATASRAGLRPGLGYPLSGEFVGFYVTPGGTRVWCLSPDRALPHAVTLTAHTSFPGASRGTTAAVAYALAAWGGATTRDAAAVESQVLNTLVGNRSAVQRRAARLPARLRRVVANHVTVARAARGSYAVRVSLPAVVTPGRSGLGAVTVRSALGRPVAGAWVGLHRSGNVAAPARVRTDGRGRAAFRYRVTDVGEVRVRALVRGLPATAVRASSPRPGEQRMVAAASRVTAAGGAAFRATPGGFSHRYACDTDCDGRPATTLRACAPAATTASRIVYRVGHRTLTSVFPAGRARCSSVSLVSGDGDRVTAVWQWRTARGWSRPVAARGSFVVDCPAPPPVGVTLAVGCTGTRLTAGLAQAGAGGTWTAFRNTSRHRMMLVVSGDRSARVIAAPGHEALWSTTAPCGAYLDLTFHGAVQRASGGWNAGPPVTVRTP